MSQYIHGPMKGASNNAAGTAGLVPAPAAGDEGKALLGNGTWGTVSGLPAVTSGDNGKVLEVSSGAWAVGSEKAPIASPVFTGSISLGRQSGTTVGQDSFAFGSDVTATKSRSFAEGYKTTASGNQSHAEGTNTIANHNSQHASGQYNVADPSSETSTTRGNYIEIVGNGTADDARSNARTLDWSGNERLLGDIYVGCNADSTGGTKLTPLPSVSGSDNGKFLCVVNGAWAAATVPNANGVSF